MKIYAHPISVAQKSNGGHPHVDVGGKGSEQLLIKRVPQKPTY